MSLSIPYKNPLRRQQGFLIPLALFILVGMLALALTASRLTGQSSVSSTLELLSTQAFYAAESGGQYAMHRLLFNNSQSDADTRCGAWETAPETLDFSSTSAAGLQACSATLTCQPSSTGGVSYYTITSSANCGAGELSAQRIIEISTYME